MRAACAALVLVLSFASPILAQSPPPDYSPHQQPGAALPPHEVLTSVRSIGLDPVSRPQLRGRVYVLRALDGSQFEKRVVVDAQTGEVLAVRDLIASPPAYTPYNPRFGRYEPPRPPGMIARATVPPPGAEPVLDEPLFPRAGRGLPTTRVPDQRSVALTPRTPLPKGRPTSPAAEGATTSGNVAAKDAGPAQMPTATSAMPAGAVPTSSTPAGPAPMSSAAALAAAATSPGKSIPAPVAGRTGTAHDSAADKPVQMVPVAPLE